MEGPKVPPEGVGTADVLREILDSSEIAQLVAELEATRWTGRPSYPLRAMVGMALAKSLYAVPTWTRIVALVSEHAGLQAALGCEGNVPSVYAAYRFGAKLRAFRPLLDACLARVTASLYAELPAMGTDLAIDASDMPAYANGQRFVSKGGRERSDDEFSDPDASWGHRSAVSTRKGGGFYGYRLHAAVCARTDLPVRGASRRPRATSRCTSPPCSTRPRLAASTLRRARSTWATTTIRVYGECEDRGVRPIIPLRQTPDVKAGKAELPSCEHGTRAGQTARS